MSKDYFKRRHAQDMSEDNMSQDISVCALESGDDLSRPLSGTGVPAARTSTQSNHSNSDYDDGDTTPLKNDGPGRTDTLYGIDLRLIVTGAMERLDAEIKVQHERLVVYGYTRRDF